MITVQKAVVHRITAHREDLQELEVTMGSGKVAKAVLYSVFTSIAEPGDEVWVNTTAVDLGLGTGGVHFVQAVVGKEAQSPVAPGHIMKLRYTPWQMKCLTVEEQDSPHHLAMHEFTSLLGTPVVVATLHSMLPLVLAGFRNRLGRSARTAYVMTDGAALPMAFSRTVVDLKKKGLLDLTITAGHAFGGDLEAITVPSALAAAKAVGEADFIVVAMGPGIVGSDTKYGFTGMEQAHILEDAERLGGQPIAVPRVSQADPRERHRGLSHHSRTVLGEYTYARAWVPLADGEAWSAELEQDFKEAGVTERHLIRRVQVPAVQEVLARWELNVTSMGRNCSQDPAFFTSAMAAGVLAAELILEREEKR